MRSLTIFAMLLACALLSCSPTTQRSEPNEGLVGAPQRTGNPPSLSAQTGNPPATGTTAFAYFGEESIEERIAGRDTIVRARLDTTTVEVATSTVEGWSDYYYVALRFHLTVSEYLKGSGANSITAFTIQGDYDTRKEAEDAMPDILAGRVTTWDDREAFFFLTEDDPEDTFSGSVQGANDYFLSVGDSEQDMYSLHNRHRKLWLPSAGTAATGDDQEFLLAAPQQGIDTPTITLGELKSRIAAVNAELNGGDGSEAYKNCIRTKYALERNDSFRELTQSRTNYEPVWGGDGFASGQPAGTEVYRYFREGFAQPAEDKSKLWLDGRDADLFAVKLSDLRPGPDFDRDGQFDLFEFDQSIVSVRPIPAGTYEFNHNYMPYGFLACDHSYSFEMTANVLTPDGSLHEFFFDPVTDGAAVAADATNGVLKPAAFTDANDSAATVSRIEWESGMVKMTVSPHTGLTGHFVDFIELDGTVSLSLAVSAATVDGANDTLSWSVTTQPWEDGDLLMVRIREPYAPAPTGLRSSRAGNGYLIAWNAVSGASQYALQTRIPGVQDWTDTTPFAEENRQWCTYPPRICGARCHTSSGYARTETGFATRPNGASRRPRWSGSDNADAGGHRRQREDNTESLYSEAFRHTQHHFLEANQ